MIRKLLLPAMLVFGLSAQADGDDFQDEWDTKGLIGVGIGYMGTNYKYNTGNIDINDEPIYDEETTSSPSLALKLGAESKHFRFFVEGQVWRTDEYNDGSTIGGALQYLIRLDEMFNIFMGVNGGWVNTVGDSWNNYGGVDAGVNIDFSESYGIEIGARYDAVSSGSRSEGKLKEFYQGYVTAIFKFTGDY